MSISLLLVLFIAVISLFIGSLALLRNNQSRVNREFFAICILAAAWGVMFELTQILYFGEVNISNQVLLERANGISYVMGLLLMFSVLVFSYSFPLEKNRKPFKFMVPVVFLTALLSLTPLVAGDVSVGSNGGFVISDGRLSFVYIAVMLLGTGVLVRNIVTNNKNLDSVQITQQRLLAFGFGASLFIGLILAVVVGVILFPDSGFDRLAPLALVFFLLPVGSAVARYKLFDFRSTLARGLAYALTIASLVLLYSATGAILLSLLIQEGQQLDAERNETLIILVIISVMSAVFFGPLKKVFDKYTSRLFYRDAYQTQDFLNEFNQVIVSTIDLTQLLLRASTTIQKYIKSESIIFAVNGSEGGDIRLISVSSHDVSKARITEIKRSLRNGIDKVIISDLLPDSNSKLKRILQDANIGLIARITTNIATEGNGYIIMGYKKSGNMYNTQDIESMEIVANELAIAMQNALQFEEIQKFNVTLQKKIEEATSKLQKSNEKLKSLDVAKDEFIGMASHQLRTPLTSVKGYVSMVLDGDAGKIEPKQRELLESAFTSSQRMVYLIADLLNVSRLKTGKFVIESKEVDLPEIVAGEVDQLKETAKNRKLKLVYERPKNFPMLMLDETKIRQVIMNFIDNAIYYTPAGGKIEVTLEHNKHSVTYKVVDNGIGVPKEEQIKLFTKFFRAGNARKARPDGTGLGLFMAKKVVVAQGGAILFESNPGKGSTFGFTFPLSAVKVPKSQ
jgi:signal transduction histidine kinase